MGIRERKERERDEKKYAHVKYGEKKKTTGNYATGLIQPHQMGLILPGQERPAPIAVPPTKDEAVKDVEKAIAIVTKEEATITTKVPIHAEATEGLSEHLKKLINLKEIRFLTEEKDLNTSKEKKSVKGKEAKGEK